MFNITFDEIKNFATLLMLELIFSFTGMFLILFSVVLLPDYFLTGIIGLIFGIIFILIFIGIVVNSFKKQNG